MWPDFTCAKRVSERREGEKKPSSEEFFYELKNRTREREPVSLFNRPFHAALAREESWSVRVKNREERNKDRASVNDSLTLGWSLRENVYAGRQRHVWHMRRALMEICLKLCYLIVVWDWKKIFTNSTKQRKMNRTWGMFRKIDSQISTRYSNIISLHY